MFPWAPYVVSGGIHSPSGGCSVHPSSELNHLTKPDAVSILLNSNPPASGEAAMYFADLCPDPIVCLQQPCLGIVPVLFSQENYHMSLSNLKKKKREVISRTDLLAYSHLSKFPSLLCSVSWFLHNSASHF